MTKPTENLDWATNGTAQEIVEPTAGMRTEGIKSGGSWYRENLNWMFNGLGKWIDYLRDNVLEAGTGVGQARNNGENDARFLLESNNLSDLVDKPTSRTNLEVLRAGTLGAEARSNTENDTRFIPKVLSTININTTPIGTQLIGNLHTISPSGVGNLVFGDDLILSGTVTLMPYSADEITTATSFLPVLTSGTWKCLGAGSFAVSSGGNAAYHAMMWQRVA